MRYTVKRRGAVPLSHRRAFRVVLVCALAALLPCCAMFGSRPPKTMAFYRDETEMRAEVLRYISIEMPGQKARETMEAHGFTCRCTQDRDGIGPEFAISDGYLICSRCATQPSWKNSYFVSDEVQVVVAIEKGKVKEVEVHRMATGL